MLLLLSSVRCCLLPLLSAAAAVVYTSAAAVYTSVAAVYTSTRLATVVHLVNRLVSHAISDAYSAQRIPATGGLCDQFHYGPL